MKAIAKLEATVGLTLIDIDLPKIGPNEVLIKILKTAICGTDLHIYQWDHWAQRALHLPLIIGHEFVGEIAQVGANVIGFYVGDLVSGEGHLICGHCRNCRSGASHLCPNTHGIGVHCGGCFAEFLVLPSSNVIKIPAGLPLEIAAILDPLGNAVHTALCFDTVGEDVLITGAGPIGIMAACILQAIGTRHVVITDVNDNRLKMAKTLSNCHTLNPKREKLETLIKKLDLEEGFDVGLEMSGDPNALEDIVRSLRHGGQLALLGILPAQTAINWDQVIFKGLTIQGIYGRRMYETWHKMLHLLENSLHLQALITHQFHFTEFKQAFQTIASGNSGKVLLNW